MSKTFTAQVEDIVAGNNERLTALMRQSIQDVVNDMQTPVGKGGKMRVDTGFLRASGQASLNGMPTGPSRGDAGGKYTYDDGSVIVTIGQLKLGSILWFGWTANYAKYREAYDGFLESALQKWPQIVKRNTELIRQKVSK